MKKNETEAPKNVKPVVCLYDIPKCDISEGFVYCDTEAMGLVVQRDRLCMVQIYFQDSAGKDHLYLVHYPEPNYKSPNLLNLFRSKAKIVFHYARQDMLMIYKYLGIVIKNVVCTKIMSKLARTYTERHGFKELCRELLKINVDKSEQSSYWGTGELTQAQIHYASKDVLYLPPIMEKLKNMLERERRLFLAERAFKILPHLTILDHENFNALQLLDYL